MTRRRKQRRGNLTRAEFKREQIRNRQNHAWAHMSEQDKRALYLSVASKLAAIRGAIVASRPNPDNLAAMFQERDELAGIFGEDVAWQIIARSRSLMESQMRLPRERLPFEASGASAAPLVTDGTGFNLLVPTIHKTRDELIELYGAPDPAATVTIGVSTPRGPEGADDLMRALIDTAQSIGLDAKPRPPYWKNDETLRTDSPQDPSAGENTEFAKLRKLDAGHPHEAQTGPEEDANQGGE